MTSGPIIEFGRDVLHLPAEMLDLLRCAAWSVVAGMWAIVVGVGGLIGVAIYRGLKK